MNKKLKWFDNIYLKLALLFLGPAIVLSIIFSPLMQIAEKSNSLWIWAAAISILIIVASPWLILIWVLIWYRRYTK